jgi:hypothetical protein
VSNVEGAVIARLGLTGQMHRAVFPRRTAAECAEITESVGSTKRQINLVIVTCSA